MISRAWRRLKWYAMFLALTAATTAEQKESGCGGTLLSSGMRARKAK